LPGYHARYKKEELGGGKKKKRRRRKGHILRRLRWGQGFYLKETRLGEKVQTQGRSRRKGESGREKGLLGDENVEKIRLSYL